MTELPDSLSIAPFTRPVRGRVALPGSKSITNRALVLAALSPGTVTLQGALFSRDTRLMIAALQELGFTIRTDEPAQLIRVTGGGGLIPRREATIDVGNAGTVARFLTALVSLHPQGVYHFRSDAAMERRPIAPLIDALVAQGARASARNFPFTFETAGLAGGTLEVDASASSQLLSALLLVAPHASTPLTVTSRGSTVSQPFVAMTQRMIAQFMPPPAVYPIEADASSASYFAALAWLTGGSVELPGLDLSVDALQGDTAFFHLLAERGHVRIDGSAVAAGQRRTGVVANFNDFSDTFLTLAAIAPLMRGPTRISGIAHTRRQESDRVAGAATELRKLGQHVVESDDSLEIHPRPLTPGVEIETYDDHRFALSFAVLGCHDLRGDGSSWLKIRHPGCCAKTFPTFFDLLARLHAASH